MDERNFPSKEGITNLPFKPLSLFLEGVDPEPAWTWNGYLAPYCLTLLAGVPKGGKTTKAFGLFKALASGEPSFLGRDLRQTGVLLLTEERKTTVAEKDARWNLKAENVHILSKSAAAGSTWEVVVAEAVRYCVTHGLGLLVVDTLAEWTGLGGDDENNAGAVLSNIKPLQDAAAAGLAVLVIAHHRKSGGKFGEAVRGSNALIAAVDVVLELVRPDEALAKEGVRLLRGTSRFAGTPDELVIVLTPAGWETRGSVDGLRSERDAGRVLDALCEVESSDAGGLADVLDTPKGTVIRHLNALCSDGTITRTGAGKRGDPFTFHAPGFLSSTLNLLVDETKLSLLGDAP